MKDNLSIKFITIKPRTRNYAIYWINTNKETHVIKYEDICSFLKPYITEDKVISKIPELVYQYRPFLLDIENQTVEEMGYDIEAGSNILQNTIKDDVKIKTMVSSKKEQKKEKNSSTFSMEEVMKMKKGVDRFYKK